MNVYLKSAVQNLDCVIAQLTEYRNGLASYLPGGAPVIGTEAFAPVLADGDRPVQTLERGNGARASALATIALGSGKRFRKAVKKIKNGGGRNMSKLQSSRSEVETGNAALSAMSAGMLRAGQNLAEPFTTTDLAERTGCTRKQAANALTRWLINGFIKRVEFGKYRRLAKFPGGKEVPAKPVGNEDSRETVLASGDKTTRETRVFPEPAREDARPTETTTPAEGKLTPYSAAGIAIGAKLKTVFTMEELAALLPQGKPAAYYFVSQWRAKDWIVKEDFDIYRKQAGFGT